MVAQRYCFEKDKKSKMRSFYTINFLTLFIVSSSVLFAQDVSLEEEWKNFELKNKQTSKRGMISLGTWATANIISGSIGAPLSSGTQRSFHLMNLSWGAVNLAIAMPGIISYMKKKEVETDPMKIYKNFRTSKTVYLLNAGLDVGYTLSGVWMYERSKRISKVDRAEMIEGFGYSVMIQGLYLLTYDAVMYGIFASRNKKYDALLKRSMVKF